MEIDFSKNLQNDSFVIGIVCARFNKPVCDALLDACLDELAELGIQEDELMIIRVPGALEIPLVLQTMAESVQYDALIALGAVIRGETYHFELVSNESAAGITRVQMNVGIPVANGVLTTDTDEQAEARAEQKGRDCARAAVEMANILQVLQEAE